MPDDRFHQSVIYIARHDDKGAFGFVLNKPLAVSLHAVFNDLNICVPTHRKQLHTNMSVLDGGPLNPEIGFVLHTGLPKWQSSVAITENICFTTSKDLLLAIADSDSVAHFHMCLGHANWHKHQLEGEIDAGDWFYTPANTKFLFNTKSQDMWHTANLMAGIQTDWLVPEMGNA